MLPIRHLAGLFLAVAMALPLPASPPPDLDLEGLAYREFVRAIYLGRFDRLNSASSPQGQATRLMVAFTSYQSLWEESCAAQTSEPLDRYVTNWFRVTKQGTWEISREFEYQTVVRVRKRFSKAYDRFNDPDLISSRMIFGVISGSGDNWLEKAFAAPGDMSRVLAQLDCRSEALALFEENLHRLVTGRPSVQASLPWPTSAPLFMAGCDRSLGLSLPRSALEASCECAHRVLTDQLGWKGLHQLEDDFDRSTFLLAAASKVGLADGLAACFGGGG